VRRWRRAARNVTVSAKVLDQIVRERNAVICVTVEGVDSRAEAIVDVPVLVTHAKVKRQ
jgi:hypothetical protein